MPLPNNKVETNKFITTAMKKCIFMLALAVGLLTACEKKDDVSKNGVINSDEVIADEVIALLEDVLGKSSSEATRILKARGLELCDYTSDGDGGDFLFSIGNSEAEWFKNGVIGMYENSDGTIIAVSYQLANTKQNCKQNLATWLDQLGPSYTNDFDTFRFFDVDYTNADGYKSSTSWRDAKKVVYDYNNVVIYYSTQDEKGALATGIGYDEFGYMCHIYIHFEY